MRKAFLLSICAVFIFCVSSYGCHHRQRISNSPDRTSLAVNSSRETEKNTKDFYYTKANIWYEVPDKISSANYHRGSILPVGTKTSDFRFSNDKIQFTVFSGPTYVMLKEEKYNSMTLREYFDQYFSKENVMAEGGDFFGFSSEEQANIKTGTIVIGMSKEATLMAYGYPPQHKTASLSDNTWTYWLSHFKAIIITFQDNKILAINR